MVNFLCLQIARVKEQERNYPQITQIAQIEEQERLGLLEMDVYTDKVHNIYDPGTIFLYQEKLCTQSHALTSIKEQAQKNLCNLCNLWTVFFSKPNHIASILFWQ